MMPSTLMVSPSVEDAGLSEASDVLLINMLTKEKLAMTTASPIPAAERMRRHRERRREGMRCLFVELRETEIDALVRHGLLKTETRQDQNAIADALYDYLERTLDPVA